jgi:hypothetical protein
MYLRYPRTARNWQTIAFASGFDIADDRVGDAPMASDQAPGVLSSTAAAGASGATLRMQMAAPACISVGLVPASWAQRQSVRADALQVVVDQRPVLRGPSGLSAS